MHTFSQILAEHLATIGGKTREIQDTFALDSQLKTKLAQENNYFAEEIVSVPCAGGIQVTADEFPKPDTTKEGLGKLKTVFKDNVSDKIIKHFRHCRFIL